VVFSGILVSSTNKTDRHDIAEIFEIQYKPAEQLIVPDSSSRGFWFMVFNATFNNISAISWRSVLLVEETGMLKHLNSLVHISIRQNYVMFLFLYKFHTFT
jgi:predicted component of type VI protein secretion system